MTQLPLVFLAFANEKGDYLATLTQERKSIQRSLEKFDGNQIDVRSEPSAEIDDIFYVFNKKGEDLVLFHYAGHASGTSLKLEGQEANAEGLANAFQRLSNLKLVFLNGCSTKAQVAKLLELGVPAVIATSVAIDDDRATSFAKKFYESLAQFRSLKAAFEFAADNDQTKSKNRANIVYRSSIDWDQISDKSDELPWALYAQDDADKILEWKIAGSVTVGSPKPMADTYKVNQYLTDLIEDLAAYDDSLKSVPKGPKARTRIVEKYSWIIGAQLRRLFAKALTTPGLPRMRQLVYTYVYTTQFLCFIMMAQLWEYLRNNPKRPNEDLIRQFLKLKESDYLKFDYLSLTNAVNSFLQSHKVSPYVPEISQLLTDFAEDETHKQAHAYMKSLTAKVLMAKADMKSDNWETLCNETEYSLFLLLKKAVFMADFKVITVRDIALYKPNRFEEGEFQLKMGDLGFSTSDDVGLNEEVLNQGDPTDSHSILLARSQKQKPNDAELTSLTDYINLSPFVIDKNTYERKQDPNVCMYAFRIKDSGFGYVSESFDINNTVKNDADQLRVANKNEDAGILHILLSMFEADLAKA